MKEGIRRKVYEVGMNRRKGRREGKDMKEGEGIRRKGGRNMKEGI
jgi:hypothetical protein